MKKTANKALALVLSLTLVLSCAGVAFAGSSGDAKVSEVVKVQEKQAPAAKATAENTAKAQVNAAIEKSASARAYGGEFKVVTLKTGNETAKESDIAEVWFDQDEIKGLAPGSNYTNIVGHSTPVKLSAKGTVTLVAGLTADSGQTIKVGLFKDANMTQPVAERYVNKGSAVENFVISVPKPGTYYLGAYSSVSSSSNTPFINKVAMAAYYMNGADRTLSGGVWSAVGQKAAQTNYFKYTAKYTGYIKVNVKGTSYSDQVTLTNYKKQARSNAVAGTRSPIVFGVLKGNTYYIKVKATDRYSSQAGYQIMVGNYGIKEYSGATRSKAKTLYKNYSNLKKGTIIAGYSTADWYKLKLTSRRDFKAVMRGATNDELKLQVYNGRGKLLKTGTFTDMTKQLTFSAYNYPAGTYYLKISRGNSLSSGWYSLYWV